MLKSYLDEYCYYFNLNRKNKFIRFLTKIDRRFLQFVYIGTGYKK